MGEREFISVAEARDILGVSKSRIAEMVKHGELGETEQNPVDRRGKLVRRSIVEALAAKAGKKESA
jgi:hypothetical protein